VFRAGFGIYHGAAQNDDLNAGLESDTFRVKVNQSIALDPAFEQTSPDLSSVTAQKQASHPRALQRQGRRDLYAEEWGLTVEHELPSNFLASAQYHINQGDFERGGHDLGVALVRGPMSPMAHELAANILAEVDNPGAARHHYQMASGLDPGRTEIIASLLARLDALEGKYEAADARVNALIADSDPSIVQIGRTLQARLGGWRGDMAAVMSATKFMSPRIGSGPEAISTLVTRAINEGHVDPAAWTEQWVSNGAGPDRPVRQPLARRVNSCPPHLIGRLEFRMVRIGTAMRTLFFNCRIELPPLAS